MRKIHHFVALGCLFGCGGLLGGGCVDYLGDQYAKAKDPKNFDGGAGGEGTGGKDGGLPPDCNGDPNDKNIIDDCGVFAQVDAPAGGDGSKGKPFSTLADAIKAAQSTGKHVYACGGAAFNEAVTMKAGIELWGGFDCANGWTWSQSDRSKLRGPADEIALTIEKTAAGAKVEGFAITAASPSDMKGGGSSIAVAVDDVEATLERCDVTAGDAADGIDGQAPSGPAMPGESAPGPNQNFMGACINPGSLAGGMPGSTMCGLVDTGGGVGGTGGIFGGNTEDGQPGQNGNPLPVPNPMSAGIGGVGQTSLGDNTKFCKGGKPGAPGDSGTPGNGGTGATDSLSLLGIANADTTSGSPGTPGQGGGGGGGSKAGHFCPGNPNVADGNGASGGGGGAGGCGGKGGEGGKAGGSSIAIMSLGSQLRLAEVTIALGKAGKGGDGSSGQGGGSYGTGSKGGNASGIGLSKEGCKGGDGGPGGGGGSGGGGRGGHAIGIAYRQAPATVPTPQIVQQGVFGKGGMGGSGPPDASNGENGKEGPCWDFTKKAACP